MGETVIAAFDRTNIELHPLMGRAIGLTNEPAAARCVRARYCHWLPPVVIYTIFTRSPTLSAPTLRRQYTITLACGADVAQSYTLQLAMLTTASLATRCFPQAVRFAIEPALAEAPPLVWPSLKIRFADALNAIAGTRTEAERDSDGPGVRTVIFGNARETKGALRATFDGWMAKVGPATEMSRLPEREYCPLAGTLAASLAISELFLSFAQISVEAGRREVGFARLPRWPRLLRHQDPPWYLG